MLNCLTMLWLGRTNVTLGVLYSSKVCSQSIHSSLNAQTRFITLIKIFVIESQP